MGRVLAALAASLAVVLVLTLGLSLLPSTVNVPIEGARLHESARVCLADAGGCLPGDAPRPAALPWHYSAPTGEGLHMARFELLVDRSGPEDGVTAVFMPRLSDSVALSVNGQRLTPVPWQDGIGRRFHHWHQPHLSMIPNDLLQEHDNRLVIELAAQGFQDLALYPVYVGDATELDFFHDLWGILRVGMARVNFSVVLLAGTALLIFWLMHRRDTPYLWLACAGFSNAAVCYHWVYPNSVSDYRVWLILWNTAAALQIWCTLNFVATQLRAPLARLRILSLAALLSGSTALLLMPVGPVGTAMAVYQLGILALMLAVLVVLLLYRANTLPQNAAVLFGLYALALSVAVAQWLSRHVWADWAPSLISPLIPAVFVLSLLWVIFFQLGRSIAQYESLMAALQTTVDEKTAELQASYDRLAERSRAQAVDEERQRILLDLHDGIGGQLVNLLAYMSAQPKRDMVLQSAIEGALRDMGLMIDSFEAGDSIATQLGLLRGRLEPMFTEHRIDLVWRIEADPQLPGAGPSQNLTLLRIVQEAITNAVRHAGARTITISASDHCIAVTDDGHGFDPERPAPAGGRRGLGLASMQRRARALEAKLEIDSGPGGTRVRLCWDS